MGSKIASPSFLFLIFMIADFILNMLFEPSLGKFDRFTVVLLGMAQLVTILLQFFCWYYILTNMRDVKHGGIGKVLMKFIPVVISVSLYFLFFIVSKAVLLAAISDNKDLFDLWDDLSLIVCWVLQRVFAVIYYAFSISYLVRIIADYSQFL